MIAYNPDYRRPKPHFDTGTFQKFIQRQHESRRNKRGPATRMPRRRIGIGLAPGIVHSARAIRDGGMKQAFRQPERNLMAHAIAQWQINIDHSAGGQSAPEGGFLNQCGFHSTLGRRQRGGHTGDSSAGNNHIITRFKGHTLLLCLMAWNKV
ncbi:hypothetical protein SDC9_93504 [bioreactor metagenome]|uniref:Uncharacterized protein n=1 Tax=bioreactor metagenome TaxID=1076179 RepID=A0A645A251_9ZZZZ